MNRFGRVIPFTFVTDVPKFKNVKECVDFFIRSNNICSTVYEDGKKLYPGRNRSLAEIIWFGEQFGFSEYEVLYYLLRKPRISVIFCPHIKRNVFSIGSTSPSISRWCSHHGYLISINPELG